MKNFFLTMFFVLFVLSANAQTTYYVSAASGSDSNNGTSAYTAFASIQAAINAAVAGDKILVTAETYTISSTLSVSANINITGGYSVFFFEHNGYTTLDGNNARRVIEFNGISNSVVFDHFIIQNGNQYNGGGMYLNSSNLSLTNIIFYSNTANGENGKGGGIYMEGSNPKLTNVAFIGNSSNSRGGALHLDGSFPILTNVTFFDNYAENTAGSIYLISDSKPVIRNTVFYGNKAGTGNANIDSYNWENCYVDLSSSNNASQYNNNIDNNTAGSTRYGDNTTYVKLTSDPFVNSGDPDGVDNIFGTRDDGLIPENQIKEKGNDSYNSLKYDLAGRYRKIEFIDIGAYEIGMVYYVVNGLGTGNNDGSNWDNAFRYLTHAISFNSRRGCIFRVAAGKIYMSDNLRITEEIEIYGGYDVMTNIQTGYSALDGQGANRVFSLEDLTSKSIFDHLIIQNGYVSNNQYGGGMSLNNSSPTLTNIIFKNNTATDGGAISFYNSSPLLNNVAFVGNHATRDGGAMKCYMNSSPTLENVVFNGNYTDSDGGAIDNSSSTLTLINATFINNSASGRGTIYNFESDLTLYNTVFYSNSPSSDVYNSSSNVAGAKNASNRSGGGLQNTEGFIVLSSDPFSNSSSPEGADGEWCTPDDGLIPANGCPLINTGDKSYNTSTTDMTGRQRVQNNRIDLGAYETGFYAATSTFTGSGSWGTDERWSAGVIDDGGTAIIDGECKITSASRTVDNLTINPSASLTIYPGAALTVNNTATNNADSSGLILQSESVGNAQFKNNSAGVRATVEQFIDENEWYYIGIPFTETPRVDDYLDGYSLLKSDEASTFGDRESGWSEMVASDLLTSGKGFGVSCHIDNTLSLYGTLNTAEKIIPVSWSGENHGWNLISNPFPCTVNWETVKASLNNVDDAIYVWDMDEEIFTSYIDGISNGNLDGFLTSMQAFFVHATAPGNVSFTESSKLTGSESQFSTNTDPLIRLSVMNFNCETDQTVIRVKSESTKNFDCHYDAYKLLVKSTPTPEIFSTFDGNKYSISTIPEINEQTAILLEVLVKETGNHTIELTEYSNFEVHYPIMLYDFSTDEIYDLESHSYSFNAIAGDTARFELIFTTSPNIVPVNLSVSDSVLTVTTDACFNAQNEITVAGQGTTVIVENNASASFIAGSSVRFLPGFYAEAGSYVHAWITTDGSFCDALLAESAIVNLPVQKSREIEEKDIVAQTVAGEPSLKIYPNPNKGLFKLQITGEWNGKPLVQVYSLTGKIVYSGYYDKTHANEIQLNTLAGMYLVSVQTGNKRMIQKIIIE